MKTLSRTVQCAKCPWKKSTNPHDIPNGYCPKKHAALKRTIAKPADPSTMFAPAQHVMACHEEHEAHCVGWLINQLGPGNNLGLRLSMRDYDNADKLRTIGDQHETFEATLPK